MPRQQRIEYKGATYHVMSRGERRQRIYEDEEDRRIWIRTLGESCERTGWRVYAWVQMDNHYHLVLKTPEANLVRGMQWLQTTFTVRMNVRHRQSGHLFGGRYKAVLVESGESSSGQEENSHPFGYLGTVLDYVHLNPARAGVLGRDKKKRKTLMDYRWSSLVEGYIQPPSKRPAWFEAEMGMGLFGLKDTAHGRREFLERLEERVKEEGKAAGEEMPEGQSLQSTLQRGWYFGSQIFREKMLALVDQGGKGIRKHENHEAAKLSHDYHVHKAEDIIARYLKKSRMSLKDLLKLPPNNIKKAKLATCVHEQTTVSLQWLSQHLQMKSASNVSHIIRRLKNSRFST
ncbi:MAG: transposase [Chthoniobacterales bacterium]